MDYGSLITISDAEVIELAITNVSEMIEFLAETDSVINEQGVYWQIQDDKLDQFITLVWGAPGNYMPLTPSTAKALNCKIEPNNSWREYHFIFRNWAFEREHWEWSFIDIENLREIRTFIINSHLLDKNQARFTNSLYRFWNKNLEYQ